MMEETQTIFAVGAGAVTKLVSMDREKGIPKRIERIFSPKYPYEYLAEREAAKNGTSNRRQNETDAIFKFFEEESESIDK